MIAGGLQLLLAVGRPLPCQTILLRIFGQTSRWLSKARRQVRHGLNHEINRRQRRVVSPEIHPSSPLQAPPPSLPELPGELEVFTSSP